MLLVCKTLLVACVALTGIVACAQSVNETGDGSAPSGLTTPVDRVIFLPVAVNRGDNWNLAEPSIAEGRIQRFDGAQLVLESNDQQTLSIESERVAAVDFAWASPEAAELAELVEQRAYRQAAGQLKSAIGSGIPTWQQQALIAAVVGAADALGNPRTAGILFLNLAASNPPPMLMADMPLCWTTREPDKVLQDEAAKWLRQDDSAAKLLGASWLLFYEQDAEARRVLLALQSDADSLIARLAAAQSWRLVPPPEVETEVAKWQSLRDAFVGPLQIGPTELIADRLMRSGKGDLAIGQWLRIASNPYGRYHRAAFALNTAARILKLQGNSEEAKRLSLWIEQVSSP